MVGRVVVRGGVDVEARLRSLVEEVVVSTMDASLSTCTRDHSRDAEAFAERHDACTRIKASNPSLVIPA